ncbi:MAG: LysR family transcriptional regulator [Clostridiales bacterium]|nr:LysR family transcriptional regulator [Clostridiales bacterium]
MYSITFQQIAMFLAVAQRLNISAVASEAYISQAALSKMIHRLEESLGVQLFRRNNRGLELTEEGEFIYSHLRYSFNSVCQTLQQAKNISAANKAKIRIGYPSTFDSSSDYDKLKAFIKNYQDEHPEIEFEETLYDFLELKRALSYAEVDVAFMHSFLLTGDIMKSVLHKPVCNCRTFIAMSVNNPLAKAERLTKEMLDGEIFYGMPLSSENAENYAMKDFKENYGFEPREYRLVPNFASLLRALSSGKGMAISGYFSKTTNETIKYFDFPDRRVIHTLDAAWQGSNESTIVRDFLKSFPSDPGKLSCFE